MQETLVALKKAEADLAHEVGKTEKVKGELGSEVRERERERDRVEVLHVLYIERIARVRLCAYVFSVWPSSLHFFTPYPLTPHRIAARRNFR